MRSTSVLVVVCLAVTLHACEGASDLGLPDASADDVSAVDLPLLADSIVIGRVDASADSGSSDPGPGPDIDAPPQDLPIFEDASEPADPGTTGDAGPVDALEDATPTCVPDEAPCPPETTCRPDDQGHGHCVPIGICNDDGNTDIADLVGHLLLGESLYVKVSAPVWVGAAACSLISCPKDTPCCNMCFAQLFIGDDETPIVLLGDDAMFGCQGTECDVGSMCEPLEPGVSYRVWGRVRVTGSRAEFQVDGFCRLDEEGTPT